MSALFQFKKSVFLLLISIIISAKIQSIALVILFFGLTCLLLKDKTIKYNKLTFLFSLFIVITIIVGVLNKSNLVLLVEEIFRATIIFLLCSSMLYKWRKQEFYLVFSILSKLIIFSSLFYPVLLYNDRFTSFFSHPNHLAYVCVLLIFERLHRDIQNNDKNTIFTVVALFVVVILSKSSGGILSAFMVLAFYFARNNLRYLVLFVGGVFVFYLLFENIEALSQIKEKFLSVNIDEIEKRTAQLAFGNDSSLVWRILYWNALLNQFYDFSVWKQLFGLGYGTMSYGNYAYFWMITDPHNDYVRKLLETGFIGIFLYYFIWLKIFQLTKLGIQWFPVFFVPLFVGNIIVNIPYLLLLTVIIYSHKIRHKPIK
jgi:hypothetical protein